jgi:ADA HAT complex component 1
MQKKKLGGNLRAEVTEAKTKVDFDWLSPLDDSDADEPNAADLPTPNKVLARPPRTPAVMRMPARSTAPASQPAAAHRAAGKKSHQTASSDAASPELPETPMYDIDMDVDLSPNTLTSNHAPSLVSDDGEYDDSDDSSASDASDAMETESVSDVAEITIDDDSDDREDTPRPPVPRRRGSTSKATTKLKKDESRHVTFVTPTPVPTNTKGRRKKI